MAIALAREGGIGVVHRNLSIPEQVAEVDRVKRSEAGMITEPVTLPPSALVRDALELMARYRISGVPITDADGLLLGILTNRDLRFQRDETRPVSELMTARGLVTAPQGTTLREAEEILHRHKIEKLPIVDSDGRITGLITVKDIQKRADYPARHEGRAGTASRRRRGRCRARRARPCGSARRRRRRRARARHRAWALAVRDRDGAQAEVGARRGARRGERRDRRRGRGADRRRRRRGEGRASGPARSARRASSQVSAFRRSRRSTTARRCARATTCR